MSRIFEGVDASFLQRLGKSGFFNKSFKLLKAIRNKTGDEKSAAERDYNLFICNTIDSLTDEEKQIFPFVLRKWEKTPEAEQTLYVANVNANFNGFYDEISDGLIRVKKGICTVI